MNRAQKNKQGSSGMTRWKKRLVIMLAAIVVFTTTYALILPAITIDEDTAGTEPGLFLGGEEINSEDAEEPEAVPAEAADTAAPAAAEEDKAEAADGGNVNEAPAEEDMEGTGKTADADAAADPERTAEAGEGKDAGAELETGANTLTYTDTETDLETDLDTEDESESSLAEEDDVTEEEPELAENEADDPMPAVTFEEWIGDTQIIVEAEKGTLPKGAEIRIEEVDEMAYLAAVEGIVDKKVSAVQAFDISFVNEDGEEIELEKPVRVTISSLMIAEAEDVQVVHAADETDAQLIADAEQDAEGNSISFTADSFSVYLVVGTEEETIQRRTVITDTYAVTVTYGPEAEIPEDAELQASEILPDGEGYESLYEKALTNINLGSDPGFDAARLFDIAFTIDDQPVQPKAPVEISICMKKEGALSSEEETEPLAFIAVQLDEDARVIMAACEGYPDQDEAAFEAGGLGRYMMFGYAAASDEGRIGVTNTADVPVYGDYMTGASITVIGEEGTEVEILGNISDIVNGRFTRWYEISHEELTGFVRRQDLDLLDENDGILEAEAGNVKFTAEGKFPDGAKLVVEEAEIARDWFVSLFNPNDQALIHQFWPYEISVEVNGVPWKPGEEPVVITVTSEDIVCGGNELLGFLNADELDGWPEENWLTQEEDTFSFEAAEFGRYIFYTTDTEFVGGERIRGTAWRELLNGEFFNYWGRFPMGEEDAGYENTDE